MRQLLPEQWASCPGRLENLRLLVSHMVKAEDLTQHALAAAAANCYLLSVAIGYQRQVLPMAWQAGNGKRDHTQGGTQITLLERIPTFFGLFTTLSLLASG
jgi:hypothetical protein